MRITLEGNIDLLLSKVMKSSVVFRKKRAVELFHLGKCSLMTFDLRIFTASAGWAKWWEISQSYWFPLLSRWLLNSVTIILRGFWTTWVTLQCGWQGFLQRNPLWCSLPDVCVFPWPFHRCSALEGSDHYKYSCVHPALHGETSISATNKPSFEKKFTGSKKI